MTERLREIIQRPWIVGPLSTGGVLGIWQVVTQTTSSPLAHAAATVMVGVVCGVWVSLLLHRLRTVSGHLTHLGQIPAEIALLRESSQDDFEHRKETVDGLKFHPKTLVSLIRARARERQIIHNATIEQYRTHLKHAVGESNELFFVAKLGPLDVFARDAESKGCGTLTAYGGALRAAFIPKVRLFIIDDEDVETMEAQVADPDTVQRYMSIAGAGFRTYWAVKSKLRAHGICADYDGAVIDRRLWLEWNCDGGTIKYGFCAVHRDDRHPLVKLLDELNLHYEGSELFQLIPAIEPDIVNEPSPGVPNWNPPLSASFDIREALH